MKLVSLGGFYNFKLNFNNPQHSKRKVTFSNKEINVYEEMCVCIFKFTQEWATEI